MKNQDVYVACYLDGTESLFYYSRSGDWYDLILGKKILTRYIDSRTLKHFWDVIHKEKFPIKYLIGKIAINQYCKDRNQELPLNRVFITKELFCNYHPKSVTGFLENISDIEDIKKFLKLDVSYDNRLIYINDSGKYINLETNDEYAIYWSFKFNETSFMERYQEEIMPFSAIINVDQQELEKKEIIQKYRKYLKNKEKEYFNVEEKI